MIFTSEQVSAGHPDKICDQISDAVLTDCLKHDRNCRVAVECMIKDRNIIICGELTSEHSPDFVALAREVLERIGLDDSEAYSITEHVSQQSPDIALGVDVNGAGDQGMMFGYATDETPEMLPLPFVLATYALQCLRDEDFPCLLPDAKSQVSFDYDRNRIDTFLISTQHRSDVDLKAVRDIVSEIMHDTAETYGLNTDFKVLVNPTGRFVIGGSFADTGLTGRKIIADTYGGACHHGGGAFSGKDPTKVDRSAAYMARKIAKDIVRRGFAKRVEVQLAYAIGISEPVSIAVEGFDTIGKSQSRDIERWIRETYDLTPAGIIDTLHLRDVDYNEVSTYGHFWRGWLPWEQ